MCEPKGPSLPRLQESKQIHGQGSYVLGKEPLYRAHRRCRMAPNCGNAKTVSASQASFLTTTLERH